MYTMVPVKTDDTSLAACSTLLCSVFPNATTLSKASLQWHYADNPNGRAVGFNAVSEDGELAAHYVCLPILARIDGVTNKGLLSMNTATHPKHQGKGLFVELARRTFDYARDAGYDFVVGAANQNSTHGFVKKLGFQLVTPLDAKIGVGAISSKANVDAPAFERIWDQASIAWRLSNPVVRYGVSGADIWAPTGRPMINALIGRHEQAATFARSGAPGVLHVWIGKDPTLRWDASRLYRDVPRRLRPSPLNLIFLDLTDEERTLNAELVKFWAMDFDAY